MLRWQPSPDSRAQMIEHYAKQVTQKKLAASAILKWARSGNGGLQN